MVALLAAFALAVAERTRHVEAIVDDKSVGFRRCRPRDLLIVQLALYRILERFEVDPFEDERWSYVVNTLKAAGAYMP